MQLGFECVLERHNRAEFQRDGHFVPGNCSEAEVVALNLITPGGDQLLRVMANTETQCRVLMVGAIREHVWTSGAANAQRNYTYAEYTTLVQERGQLAALILERYAYEIASGEVALSTGPIHIAAHFLKRERSRWWVRLRNRFFAPKLTAPPLAEGNDWIPREWK